MIKKPGHLEAKKQRARHARLAEASTYVPPAGHEVLPYELLSGVQISPDTYVEQLPDSKRRAIFELRRQKQCDERPKPSIELITIGESPATEARKKLVDYIASLVDENIFGRHDMCQQYAALLAHSLRALGLRVEARAGRVQYRRTSGNWTPQFIHAWVTIGDDSVIDGNADSLRENSALGQGVIVRPFWGPMGNLPDDRKFPAGHPLENVYLNDPDIVRRWRPMLDRWLQEAHLV